MKTITIKNAGHVDDFKLTEVYAAYSKFSFKEVKKKHPTNLYYTDILTRRADLQYFCHKF